MLTIRRCFSCGMEFDVEVGTADVICPACRDLTERREGVMPGTQCNQPRKKHGESWEEQAQRLAAGKGGAKDRGNSAIDTVLRSCGGVHLKKK